MNQTIALEHRVLFIIKVLMLECCVISQNNQFTSILTEKTTALFFDINSDHHHFCFSFDTLYMTVHAMLSQFTNIVYRNVNS